MILARARRISLAMMMGALMMSTPAPAAGFVSGKLLLEMCTGQTGVLGPSCMGYMAGVADLYLAVGQTAFSVCLPLNVSGAALATNVVSFLSAHPDGLTSSGSALIMIAFAAEYPCK